MQSTRFSLQWRDILKGLLVAFGTAFLTSLTQSLNSGTMPTLAQLKISAIAGVSAIVIYLTKNFFTDDVKVATKTLDDANKKQTETFYKNEK